LFLFFEFYFFLFFVLVSSFQAGEGMRLPHLAGCTLPLALKNLIVA